MADCPTDEDILALVAGTADSALHTSILRHIDGCAQCRLLVAESVKHARPNAGSPKTDFTVGRYEIRALLGAGGSGTVYEAFDPQLSRRLAVKLVHPTGGGSLAQPRAEEQNAKRLLREARAMAQLSHPNVVTVFDAGSFEDRVFIAMELVEGQTLAAWIAEHKPDWRQIVKLYCEAGRGLVAAHAAGLVHGDFKPENVLVGRDGRPRVTDFGLARPMHLSDEARAEMGDERTALTGHWRKLRSTILTLTEAGVLAGTPAYMAPEQFQGQHADSLTDQFNFCASLWVALYSQLPFVHERSPNETLFTLARAVFEGKLRPPPKDTQVPQTVQRIVAQGLSVKRKERFASMEVLLTLLESAITERADTGRPQSSRPPRYRPWVPATLAAATLLAAGFVFAPTLRNGDHQNGPIPVRVNPTASVAHWDHPQATATAPVQGKAFEAESPAESAAASPSVSTTQAHGMRTRKLRTTRARTPRPQPPRGTPMADAPPLPAKDKRQMPLGDGLRDPYDLP